MHTILEYYLSDIFLQSLRLSSSIFLHCCAKVLRELSARDWQPLRLRVLRKPPHLCAIFSTTMPCNKFRYLKKICYQIIHILRRLSGSRTGLSAASSCHPRPVRSIAWTPGRTCTGSPRPSTKISWTPDNIFALNGVMGKIKRQTWE